MNVHQPLIDSALKHTKVLERIIQHASARKQPASGDQNSRRKVPGDNQLFNECSSFISDVNNAVSKLYVYSANRDCAFSRKLLEAFTTEVKRFENAIADLEETAKVMAERDLLEQTKEHLANLLISACARAFIQTNEDESTHIRNEKRFTKGNLQASVRGAVLRPVERRLTSPETHQDSHVSLEEILKLHFNGKFEEFIRKLLDEFDATWSSLRVAQLAAKSACAVACSKVGLVDNLFLETDLIRGNECLLRRAFHVRDCGAVLRRSVEVKSYDSSSRRSDVDSYVYVNLSRSIGSSSNVIVSSQERDVMRPGGNDVEWEAEPRTRSGTLAIGQARSVSNRHESDNNILEIDVETLLEEWHAFSIENTLFSFALRLVRDSRRAASSSSPTKQMSPAECILSRYVEQVRACVKASDDAPVMASGDGNGHNHKQADDAESTGDCLLLLAAPGGDANCETLLLRALDTHLHRGDFTRCVELLDSRLFERVARASTRAAFVRLLPFMLVNAAVQHLSSPSDTSEDAVFAYLDRVTNPCWWLLAVERVAEQCPATMAVSVYQRAMRFLSSCVPESDVADARKPPFVQHSVQFMQHRIAFHSRVVRIIDLLRSRTVRKSTLAGRVFATPAASDAGADADAAVAASEDVAVRVRRCDTQLLSQVCDANEHDLALELVLYRRDELDTEMEPSVTEDEISIAQQLALIEQHRVIRRLFESTSVEEWSVSSLKAFAVDSAGRLDERTDKQAFYLTLARFIVENVDGTSERSSTVAVQSLVALCECALESGGSGDRVCVTDMWLCAQLVANLPSRSVLDCQALLKVLRTSSDVRVEAMVARLVCALVRARPSVVGITFLKQSFTTLSTLDRVALDELVVSDADADWPSLRSDFTAKIQSTLFQLADCALRVDVNGDAEEQHATLTSKNELPSTKLKTSTDSKSSPVPSTPTPPSTPKLPTSAENNVASAQSFVAPKVAVPREKWSADGSAVVCECCVIVRFTTFTRRHHCRHCGRVVCYRCSVHRATVGNEKAARVCKDCRTLYTVSSTQSQIEDSERPRSGEVVRISGDGSGAKPADDRPTNDSIRNDVSVGTDGNRSDDDIQFTFSDAPNVDVCIALLEIDVLGEPATLAKADWLISACDRLTRTLTSLRLRTAPTTSPIDPDRLRGAVERCILHAKLLFERAGVQNGVLRCETFASVLRLLTLTAATGSRSSLNADQLTIDQVRMVRDKLLENGEFETAIELSTKFGLDAIVVFFRYGLALLRTHRFADAQAKFNKCLGNAALRGNEARAAGSKALRSDSTSDRAVGTAAEFMLREIVTTLESELDRVKRGGSRKADILIEQIVQETVFYLRTFSHPLALVRFYCRHALFERALRTLVDSDCPPDTFTLAVLPHALESSDNFSLIRTGMLQIDSSLRRFETYLAHACAQLNRSGQFVTLVSLQAFMHDYVRAALTCINEFYLTKSASPGTRQLLTFADLHARAEHLQRARQFFTDYLTELRLASTVDEPPSMRRGARMEKSDSDVRKYVVTIDYQLEIVDFLVEYLPLYQMRAYASNVLPTLFGDAPRRFELAVILLERAVHFTIDEERLESNTNGGDVDDDDSSQERTIRSLELDRALRYVRIVCSKFLVRLSEVLIEVSKRLLSPPCASDTGVPLTPAVSASEQPTSFAGSSTTPIDLHNLFILLDLVDVIDSDAEPLDRSSSSSALASASESSSLALLADEFDRALLAILNQVLVAVRPHLSVPACVHGNSGHAGSVILAPVRTRTTSATESVRSYWNAPTGNTSLMVCTIGSSKKHSECSLVLNLAKMGDEFAILKEQINELVELVHLDQYKVTALMRVGKLKAAYLLVVSTYKSTDDVRRIMDAAAAIDELPMKRLCAVWLQKNASQQPLLESSVVDDLSPVHTESMPK